MIKISKVFVFVVVCLFSLKLNYVLAVDCTRNVELGDGAGVYCYNNNGYCEAYCSAGWKESCASTETAIDVDRVQCFITDSTCNNRKTCYNCITTPITQKYYKCNTPLDGTCIRTDNAYSPSDNDSNGHQVQNGVDIWQYESTCRNNCVAPWVKCYDQIDPESYCDDGNSCTDDSCSTSTGNCTHTDNGSCDEVVTDTCQAVSDPCYLKIGTKCYPQYATVNFIDGAYKPENCTCTQIYNTFKTGCDADGAYLCSNSSGNLVCYDRNVCGSCGALYEQKKCDNDDSKTGWVCTPDSGECGAGKWFDYCKPPCDLCLFHSYAPDYADKEGYYTYLWDSSSDPTCTARCPTGEQCINTTCCLPVPGVCGVADKQVISDSKLLNYSNLCAVGSSYSIPSCTANTCTWVCFGYGTGNCAASSAPTSCSVTVNSPPVFQSLVLKNNEYGVVQPQDSINNHICQSIFNGSSTVNVTVSATDPNGVSDISDIQLKWNNITFTRNSLVDGVANFSHTFDSSQYNNGTFVFLVSMTDLAKNTTGWINTNRHFKFWDCKVPISGTIYDGTDGASCPNTGFGVTNPDALNLKTLVFKQNDIDFTMSIGSDKTSYYSDSNNSLIWGSDIAIPYFNRATNDIALSSPILIKTLSSSGVSTCSSDYFVNTYTNIDPYATSIGITADFTGTLVQDPWWQANGGGVISNFKIKDQVPVTCNNNDNCKISIGGLAAAPDVDNKGKSLENAQTWYYANTLAKLANYNTNYDYFYTQYFVKKAVGTVSVGKTITSVNDLGNDSNGIYFINGDLTINGDVINTGDFLMMIVKGSVNVDIGVSQVDGILVANSINASGSSDNQLVFNGSLYASDTINFSRDFTTRLDNNTKPAVVVNYDPKLIFNIPGSIAKVLTNWQWGN